jgi:hypothetical protein
MPERDGPQTLVDLTLALSKALGGLVDVPVSQVGLFWTPVTGCRVEVVTEHDREAA